MWTKGNKNGEWEADGDPEKIVIDVFAEHHLNCDTMEFCCDDLLSVEFSNPHDLRLFQLAPRMAETLISLVDNWRAMIDRQSSVYVRKTTLNLGEVDDLIKELQQMKHGEK